MAHRLALPLVLLLAVGACGRSSGSSSREDVRAEPSALPASRVLSRTGPSRRYAQRVTELHLGSRSGPVVARAHPGAALEVVEAEAGTVQATLPDFVGPDRKPVVLVGEASAFGAERGAVAAPAYAVGTRRILDMPGLEVRATATSESAFAQTLCGEVRVVERAGNLDRIAQVHGGVELLGWVDSIHDSIKRGPLRCATRVVERTPDGRLRSRLGSTESDWHEVSEIPAGYTVREPAPPPDLMADVMTRVRTVHWLVVDARKQARCRPWTFRPAPGKPTEGLLTMDERIARIASFDRPGYASFGAVLERSELVLFGPYFSSQPRRREAQPADVGGYKCAHSAHPIGQTAEALRIDRVGTKAYEAWHPDEEERWYFSRASCEQAAELARAALARDPEADPPGGVHRDCGQELIE